MGIGMLFKIQGGWNITRHVGRAAGETRMPLVICIHLHCAQYGHSSGNDPFKNSNLMERMVWNEHTPSDKVQKNPGQLAGKQPRSRHSSPNRSRSPSTPRRASPQAEDGCLRTSYKHVPPENQHDNGKSAIWRCISYWKLWFSNVMLVFRGVTIPTMQMIFWGPRPLNRCWGRVFAMAWWTCPVVAGQKTQE